MASFERGEVWLVDLGYVAKTRPCLILSVAVTPDDRALVTCVPHTTAARGTRFEVALSLGFLQSGVFDAQNLVTTSLVKPLRRLGVLSPDQFAPVEDAVRRWLGL